MATRRLLTLHAPLNRILSGPVLLTLDEALKKRHIEKWWISPEELPDLVVMGEIPEQLLDGQSEEIS